MAPNVGASEPLKEVADSLRRKGGVEWRNATLGSERVEFFRGKDFVRYFHAHPDLLDSSGLHLSASKTGSVDEKVQELATRMLRKGFFWRCDRFYKRPKPGKKGLVKFPRKLERCQDQMFDENSFYAWTYDRPTSPWFYFMSALLGFVVLAVCMFPLAPYRIKIAVVYLSLSLLCAIFGIILLRVALFAAVWIPTGYEFWLFPNLLSETVGLDQAFIPVISFEKPKTGKWQWLYRIGTAVGTAGMLYMLHRYTPDQGSVGAGARRAHDSILEFLDLHKNISSIADGLQSNDSQAQPSHSQHHSQQTAHADDGDL